MYFKCLILPYIPRFQSKLCNESGIFGNQVVPINPDFRQCPNVSTYAYYDQSYEFLNKDKSHSNTLKMLLNIWLRGSTRKKYGDVASKIIAEKKKSLFLRCLLCKYFAENSSLSIYFFWKCHYKLIMNFLLFPYFKGGWYTLCEPSIFKTKFRNADKNANFSIFLRKSVQYLYNIFLPKVSFTHTIYMWLQNNR